MVSAIIIFGTDFITSNFSNTTLSSSISLPSHLSTCHPKLLNFNSKSPRSDTFETRVSDCNLL